MKKRDSVRENIKKVKGAQKVILLSKYNQLRNLINQKIRKETNMDSKCLEVLDGLILTR